MYDIEGHCWFHCWGTLLISDLVKMSKDLLHSYRKHPVPRSQHHIEVLPAVAPHAVRAAFLCQAVTLMIMLVIKMSASQMFRIVPDHLLGQLCRKSDMWKRKPSFQLMWLALYFSYLAVWCVPRGTHFSFCWMMSVWTWIKINFKNGFYSFSCNE